MSMGGTDNVREYYRLVTEMDIGEVARELLPGRITQETGQRLMCDCPNHQSQSRLSLHVMLDKQGWYCFGCGVGGDVLQLVEFIQTGSVTAGPFCPCSWTPPSTRMPISPVSRRPNEHGRNG